MSLHSPDFKIGNRRHKSFSEEEARTAKCHVWGAIAAAVIGGTVTAVEANQNRKAAEGIAAGQQKISDNLTYQPIDIAALTKQAQEQATANATNSLALERSLQPGVAATRAGLQQSIANQLSLGGTLPADTIHQVENAARVSSGNSGTLGGSSIPLTAQMLGISSLGLLNQRQQNAAGLLAANPLPVAGLDPGSLASLETQQNAAQNQFNLAKAGISSNLVNSQGNINMANAAQNNQLIGQAGSLLTGSGNNNNAGLLSSLSALFGKNNNPNTNPISVSGGFGGSFDSTTPSSSFSSFA